MQLLLSVTNFAQQQLRMLLVLALPPLQTMCLLEAIVQSAMQQSIRS
jgi:hypothetical protein